jgi:catechol 2,3-dioxygenase-like lactoylglutathione lyase family enzyme
VPIFELTEPRIDVAIVCADFDTSLDFYHQRLGLEIAYDVEIDTERAVRSGLAPGPFRHVRLRAGNALIKLMQIDPPPAADQGGFHAGVRWLTFFVRDLDDTIKHLTERRVAFLSEPVRGLAGRFACVQAPDGVILEFVQLFRHALAQEEGHTGPGGGPGPGPGGQCARPLT